PSSGAGVPPCSSLPTSPGPPWGGRPQPITGGTLDLLNGGTLRIVSGGCLRFIPLYTTERDLRVRLIGTAHIPPPASGRAAPPPPRGRPRPRPVRAADGDPRHAHRQRRAAEHRAGPSLLGHRPVLGAQRLRAHVRRPAPARRAGRRHPGPAPRVPHRHRPVHAGVAGRGP